MHGRNYILGVCGRKGSGKSTFVTEKAKPISRLAVVDTLMEYAEFFPPLSLEESFEQPEFSEQVRWLAEQVEGNFQTSFFLPSEHTQEAFTFLCRAAMMAKNLTLIIEEIDYFSKPTFNEPGLDLLIRYGRHYNVNVIYTVRNLVETSRRLTSQTDAFVLFRIDEPRYLKEIAVRFNEEIANIVANLGEHDYYTVRMDELTRPQATERLQDEEEEQENSNTQSSLNEDLREDSDS